MGRREYTAILYCTLLKFIDRQIILELERSFGSRLAQTDTSLLSLLLALVASMVLLAPPPPAKVLLGCHLEPGTSAEVRVPALCLMCWRYDLITIYGYSIDFRR